MPVYVHGLATAVPPHHHSQERASEFVQEHASEDRAVRRIIRSLYRNSGIDKRHTVIPDWRVTGEPSLFFEADGSPRPQPDTRIRNDLYTREARKLYTELAHRLVDDTPGFEAADVTHVITVSCTGFYAPGPDYDVVRALGLPGSTLRYHLGFMGCYAALPGLRMAEAFCRADPDAVVLVLAVELCSLHLQFNEDTDDLIAGSVFADGGSGALVSARGRGPLEILTFRSALTDEGEADMAWTLGSHGFRMKLSTYVPELIEANLEPVLAEALGASGLTPAEVEGWAVHPGGRAILDRVEGALGLGERGLRASRSVLREYGNMSSATILFVLRELLEGDAPDPGSRLCAMAFGPGLTIESAIFRVTGEE